MREDAVGERQFLDRVGYSTVHRSPHCPRTAVLTTRPI
jgi:hypothetical protein